MAADRLTDSDHLHIYWPVGTRRFFDKPFFVQVEKVDIRGH